jgi:four helix bundle protein
MSRDHRKLRVFQEADQLVETVYRVSQDSARQSEREYLNFLNIATGSAAEVEYLLPLAVRLGFLEASDGEPLAQRYASLSAGLRATIRALEKSRQA